MADRVYQILARSVEEIDRKNPTLIDLGRGTGHDGKAAVEDALAVYGIPEGVKICIAIPINNWSEFEVEPDPRPQFKVRQRASEAPADPPPPPADPGVATS